ncbi:hypothetical protein MNBD_UNCLBAC01-1118 [hydrothermal vent metagenome]|uniref:Lipopolysaccharide export system permease protein LptG n=1 Tax=hydrothermal vent metagenome TaxID=652676 RepID=A0A3B1CZ12_9ZZZZ
MRIIDRHINSSILKIFLSTIFIFCFLYVMIEITSSLDEIIDRKISTSILIQYYTSFLPIIFTQTAPFACLISIMLTFSGLNNHNEIIVLRASGQSFWQITRSAACFAMVISILIFFVNEKLVPQATEISKKIRNENMILEIDRVRKKKEKIKNLTFYGLKNRLYFIDTFSVHTEELQGITIIEHDEHQNIKQKIVALKGKWTGIAWKFYQCQITTYKVTDISTPIKIKIYKEKLMNIEESPNDFLTQRLNVNSMNIRQLQNYITRFAKSGATKALNNLRVDLHQKIAYPFATFVITLLGLPFALMVKGRKGATFTSIGIAVGIGFIFYVTNAVFIAFGKGNFFPPILSAWIAPLLFCTIAITIIETDFSN